MAHATGDGADDPIGGLEQRVIAGRFRVVELVAEGANTIIANAVDSESNQPVTVKIVRPELATTDEFRRAFRRHVETAMALSHPNIAAVIDHGEVEVGGDTTVFWVVEYLGGGSLRDLFDRNRLLQASQALVVGLEACRALDAAHQRGIVHTELTPSKLVFGDDRRLRIVDFGMARLLGAPAWSDPAHVPTHVARYASPEQALGLEVDARTDVYALALTLIEAVTGAVPFAADSTVSTLTARVGKLMPVSADLGSLAAVLERAGRPAADDRYTAAEFGRALVQAAEALPRPEPIPIITGGLFVTSELRRPPITPDAVDDEATPTPPADATPETDAAADEPVDESGAVEGADVAAAVEPADGSGAVEGAEVAAAVEPVDGLADESAAVEGAEVVAAVEPVDGLADGSATVEGAEVAAAVGSASVEGADHGVADTSDVRDDPASDPAPDEVAADEVAPPVPPAAPVAPAVAAAGAELSAAQGAATINLLTDVADPPTGAVEVGAAGDDPGVATRPAASTRRLESPPLGAPAGPGAPGGPAATAVLPTTPPAEPPAVYDEERSNRRVAKIVSLTLVVLVGLAALSYAGWLLLRTKSFDVPDLAGVNEDVALNEIAGNGWLISVERERSDEEPTIDNVIRTVPGPGVTLDEGAEFLLVVSDGPELRTLPELDGLRLVEAEARLIDLRLVPVVEARAFSETVPLDAVISWQVQGDPAAVAGTQVLPDTTILMTVSDGPEPRPAPDVVTLFFDDAVVTIESLQLVAARGEDVFSDEIETGFVVSQEPPPGTPVERGGTVTVQVSKGPDLVAVPDLTGLVYGDAEALLLETGFTIGNLLGTTEGTFVSLTIDGESVEVGQLFRRGTAIDLIFL